MFRNLRVKFIAVVMMSVALVLGIVFTAICVNEYQRSINDVQQALAESLDRVGSGRTGHAMELSSGSSAESLEGNPQFDDMRPPKEWTNPSQMESGDFYGPRIGGNPDDRSSMVPVAVYAVSETESYSLVSTFTTAQIDSDVLDEASTRLANAEEGFGTLGDIGLHYEKRVMEQTTYVAFADTSFTSSWESLAMSLAIAAIGILAVFFVIAWFLSNWALRPVREAWDSQRQFVADASHELKTPLTVILANNSILMKHAQDSIASQSQWIESTQEEAISMQSLVNEMLELAQVESRAAIQHDQLDFSDLVDGIALQFESVAFERGCTLEESIEEGISVNGDESRLRKAVSTLIENALKYVDEGGTVTVTLKHVGKNAELKINNTGSLIDAEDLPHIFDRFYRTDKARTSGTGGFGLGLAIAREIAREHDGDITCTSTVENGTTFTATIPVK